MNDSSDANDANIEFLFQSFIQDGISTLTGNEIQLGCGFPKTNGQYALDKNFDHTNSSIFTKGLENSVIPVIPVIETQMINPEQKGNLEQEQINHTNNIRHKWEGGDIWVCDNCNDNGDKWHMLKHPCKNNKK